MKTKETHGSRSKIILGLGISPELAKKII